LGKSYKENLESVYFNMNAFEYNDYDDALELINQCVLCLKDGGNIENILGAMLKSFEADQAVFLSAKNKGVDLLNSHTLCADKSYLNQYADHFWRYDPLFDMQFCPTPDNLVFKTDDIIPYSRMVELEYYNSFLRPQNLLGELIIRLYIKQNFLGAISLQRFKDRPNFTIKDTRKASLLVPYLFNIFETAHTFFKMNEELTLLEESMESQNKGIILLDSQYKPLYFNSKARSYCQVLLGVYDQPLSNGDRDNIAIPDLIIQDCLNLTRTLDSQDFPGGLANRILETENQMRFFVQYFPIASPNRNLQRIRFIIFLNDLTTRGALLEPALIAEQTLSEREKNIAQYASLGLTNKQIAVKLNISPFTVQNHLKNIFEKTGLDSRTKLANLIKFSDAQLF
jgi:DNA-binding CsgD family transcriptional regulator